MAGPGAGSLSAGPVWFYKAINETAGPAPRPRAPPGNARSRGVSRSGEQAPREEGLEKRRRGLERSPLKSLRSAPSRDGPSRHISRCEAVH